MGKKKLPLTKAETAEQRLEELVNNKSITFCEYPGAEKDRSWLRDGEARVYPDGFEAVIDGNGVQGYLRIERRNFFVCYNLDVEYEKQGKSE